MSFSGAFYMEGAPVYEQRSGGSCGVRTEILKKLAVAKEMDMYISKC